MNFACGNVASIASAICLRFATDGERHFAIEDDVSCYAVVRVVGIIRVWSILPDERVRETFRVQVRFQFADVHAADYTGVGRRDGSATTEMVYTAREYFGRGEGHF